MKFAKIIAAAALAFAGVAAGAAPAAAAPITAGSASASTFMAVSAVSNIQRYRDGNRWGRDDRRWDRRDRRRGWDRRRYNRSRYYRSHRPCWNEWRRGRPVTVCARR